MDNKVRNELINQLSQAVKPNVERKKEHMGFNSNTGTYEVYDETETEEEKKEADIPNKKAEDMQLEKIMVKVCEQRKEKKKKEHQAEKQVDPRMLFLKDQFETFEN